MNRIPYLRKFCTSTIKIPELEEAQSYIMQGKLPLAVNSFSRALDIMISAKINKSQNKEFIETLAKLAGSNYLLGKYKQVEQTLKMGNNEEMEEGYKNYLEFVGSCAKVKIEGNLDINKGNMNSIVNKLLLKEKTQEINVSTFPIVSSLANNLNNSTNYQKSLSSLIQRSPKSQKENVLIPELTLLKEKEADPEIQILYLMGILLKENSLTSVNKEFLNNRTNEILKKYEEKYQREVYKPLLVILMSLIGENHYMSAEGMIGFIKGEESDLLKGYKSEDKNLIENIYRMLVTRANNEVYEVGWAKEEPVLFGDLVVERIIKAPLLGRSFNDLIL